MVKKVPTEKMEDLMVTQIHISLWARLRDFEELGYTEVLVGQVLIGRPWNLAIYGKKASVLVLDNRLFAFEKVSVFKILLCLNLWFSVFMCA